MILVSTEYYSPPWVAEVLEPHIQHLTHIVDPAAGRGGFTKVLSIPKSRTIVQSDIIGYSNEDVNIPAIDFFSERWERSFNKALPKFKESCGGVVTAPPVHLIEQFWARAMRLTAPRGTVALWLSATSDTEARYAYLFANSDSFYKKIIPVRPALLRESTPMAWYMWRHGYGGAPMLVYTTIKDPPHHGNVC